ncbi:MAG: excinuclease ABC subunit UvrA [Candidatus Marinimicrobia bacterium]|jgi:excinuclease ABC subunit A|nr:excinuclease ABC subunit UvrA [Candidatus Neomarinimicrobiota bacterium]MBT3633187.1 excinuclease ABC subunit UvrA [Candidatus Neomarinimicrobiota bacterium]MBT3682212.1 excinuclease ABC subunit UvrA [Candidatus Neomarinimicrobiota bacterium]MBT3758787.1 excinuclease ABC subunit UvrA [Candidatus Neomarinimicrobiota bacterium]MBT3895339.1 excinuclease ABC subunit UvrA [Candidatus Neomarinimicrobiota bacterium]
MKNHKKSYSHNQEFISIKGAREHNLKNIDVKIPRNNLVVITGLSGSGKSSLAFDTLYAEGQRRYVESLSSYARQFLGIMEKPDADHIDGMSPAISIEQKSTSRNPRSTVGTITEIYDYMRLLYARVGTQTCYKCGGLVQKQTVQQIVDHILSLPEGTKFHVLAPVVRSRKGEFKEVMKSIAREGFLRIRVDGKLMNVTGNIALKKTVKHNIEVVVDRLVLKSSIKERLTASIELALKVGNGLVFIHETGNVEHRYSENYSCPKCEISFEDLHPRIFSFNSPFGACSVCSGLGTEMSIDPDLVVPDISKSIIQGCIEPIGEQPRGSWYSAILKSLSKHYGFSFTTPWKDLSGIVQKVLLHGTDKDKNITIQYTSSQFKGEYKGGFEGVIPNLKRRHSQTKSGHMREWIEKYMTMQPCRSCKGSRLKRSTMAVLVATKNIHELTEGTIGAVYSFFEELELNKRQAAIAEQIIKEIKSRLSFLVNVGLDYLTLNRSSGTLSGGEAQRIRLATQIGSQLMGVLYVLDEPSIGLHQRDNVRLIKTLNHLRDLGNTVIVVEHDEETIRSSDWVVDLGPGAGIHGGEIVAEGGVEDIIKCENSITGQYLSKKRKIEFKHPRRRGNKHVLSLLGARGHNLKDIDLKIPLGKFVCVTGVSGSGKSSLINHTLYPILSREFYSSMVKPLTFRSTEGLIYLDKVVSIDQSPIGKTPRSNPATYTGLFTHIRDLFSQLPESKIRGYKPGRFSFNVKGGRCETCEGVGLIKIEMHFLADMYIQCEDCKGKRYNRETLEITFRGKSVADILAMSIEEALEFFKNHLGIHRKLQTLFDVGLGYIKLGQQATTLSGGESQRVKLSSELSRIGTGSTIYLLDEPTTGLHFEDVKMLLHVLHSLVDKGNSVIVIEHNLDVIKTADWIIDLGPEGGFGGGSIIAQGTPEQVSRVSKSYTGQFLKNIF